MQNDERQEKLPESPEPYWRDDIDLPQFDRLDEDIEADVVIVGGGITGITAAYLLTQKGKKVALLEADRILNGVTGHTTAKITAQHGLIYDELIQHMGKSKARLYYEANTEALEFIKETANEQDIDCDLIDQDAYMYATSEQYASKLAKEYQAYQKLNIDGEFTEDFPFNIKIHHALSMKNQAQFHPVKYLSHLARLITEKGGQIYEGTTAVDVNNGGKATVITSDGNRARADYVLACSHYPFYDGLGFYFTRMYADRSYIVAVKTDKEYPGGMYISVDKPVRSLRSANINGENIILIAGESHKTGQGEDTLKHYEALEKFGERLFGDTKIIYRWSAQDLVTVDKVPYVGRLTSGQPNVLVATGYRKWGMTNGTAAALILSDMVSGEENRYEDVFSPSRFYADPSLKEFLTINADVAKHLFKGKFQMPSRKAGDLSNDEGSVVLYEGGRAGAYKDTDGELHIVDTTCTHLGCEVEWNHGDRTWDCPCHGSRFSYNGDVVEGPAEKPLKRLK